MIFVSNDFKSMRQNDFLNVTNFYENVNEVIFKLAHHSLEGTVYWYLDSKYIGKTETFHELAVSPKPGKYLLTAVDKSGNELREQIEVKSASQN
ncbi:hypothetical protein ESU54_00355 [Aequorivita antarctica]|uniref:Penicillin-binding C-terminal domain-containing protein n=2 Tax=Aequorivita antarctica TaxID=153266 RepID=A0A5C6Z4K3_9FLAO|nr:hypothetical protein ESU54_00355 [Aequorivita antarctica]